MKCKVKRSSFTGEISAIPSKSFLHRALIISALCDSPTVISNMVNCDDVKATMACLSKIGVGFSIIDGAVKVTPISSLPLNKIKLNCNESGSTLRFMLPILAVLGISADVDGKGELRKRPIDGILKVLSENGIEFSSKKLPLTIGGQLKSGTYLVKDTASTQYVSGLLMALPKLSHDSEIVCCEHKNKKGYVEITIEVLRAFGIKIIPTATGYIVPGGQKFISPKTYQVEGDWTLAANWLTAAALSGEVLVSGLNLSSCQGDSAIVDILKEAGVKVDIIDDKVHVCKSNLKPIEFEGDSILDIIPVIAMALSTAKGVSIIKNVERLKCKESDRLAAIITALTELGVKAEYKEKQLYIYGSELKKIAEIDLPSDHRIAMALSVIGLLMDKLVFDNAESVNKSYPNFYSDYEKLGGVLICQ
ncbi:MAG: 3-phosphoshikimate 1-carboxyvinyltransferase [Clostridia bacterium]